MKGLSNISKGWVTLILGPLSGLWIIAQHPDEVNTIIGAITTIITVGSALAHDIEQQKIQAGVKGTQQATVAEPAIQ